MNKRHVWPDGHWNWPVQVTHKHGVRCGDMIWVGGQVDMTPTGEVCNPDDLATQTRNVMKHFNTVLRELDCELVDLVQLLCFYVNDGSVAESGFLKMVADTLPPGTRTTITAVPVPWLAYPGLQVEIEGYAMRAESGEPLSRRHAESDDPRWAAPFSPALRCGKMIFVSAQDACASDGNTVAPDDLVGQSHAAMIKLGELLAQFGADYADVVKHNRWYCGRAGIEDFEPAALACASYYPEPGPAATGIPLPRHANPEVLAKVACTAMLGIDGERLPRRHVWPDSLWDWTVHLPYKHGLKCDNMIYLGGQVSLDKQGRAVHPGELSRQTHQAMEHIGTLLNALDASYDDVCKVTTFYDGACGGDALHANLPIRSSYFSDPGPATTGIPLPELAYEQMMVEIEIFAMTDSD